MKNGRAKSSQLCCKTKVLQELSLDHMQKSYYENSEENDKLRARYATMETIKAIWLHQPWSSSINVSFNLVDVVLNIRR
ncbi:hypothetical protein HYC85_028413 [Camellia sinensis]|uniref:Uncharacterized protein n=1 Tax=Camellia sinensis TaxID=4442 RepID=A0A7J7FV93_CAMSI|nr:hypothetical protein HYC85_028413 [Camellia sinensis]